MNFIFYFFFSSRRRHTRWNCDWSSDVCSSDLRLEADEGAGAGRPRPRRGGLSARPGRRGSGRSAMTIPVPDPVAGAAAYQASVLAALGDDDPAEVQAGTVAVIRAMLAEAGPD